MLTKERLIYTAGTFKIDEDLARARRLIIRSSVLRLPPTTNYQNERSNPSKYFLGYCTVFINDYVYEIFPIEFEQQIILLWDNPEFQVFAKAVCESANISGNIARLGAAMTPPALLIPIPGIPGTFSGCPYTNLKFKLVFGTRLQISASGEPMEFCEGYEIPSTVPNLDPPPLPYPPEQARDEDPPRSQPEEGENLGDTAPPTILDPEADLTPPQPCVTVIRGSGLNTQGCGKLPNQGDYSYNGYADLEPITLLGCAGLQLFIDGVSQGDQAVFHPDATILSRTGDCVPPF